MYNTSIHVCTSIAALRRSEKQPRISQVSLIAPSPVFIYTLNKCRITQLLLSLHLLILVLHYNFHLKQFKFIGGVSFFFQTFDIFLYSRCTNPECKLFSDGHGANKQIILLDIGRYIGNLGFTHRDSINSNITVNFQLSSISERQNIHQRRFSCSANK